MQLRIDRFVMIIRTLSEVASILNELGNGNLWKNMKNSEKFWRQIKIVVYQKL